MKAGRLPRLVLSLPLVFALSLTACTGPQNSSLGTSTQTSTSSAPAPTRTPTAKPSPPPQPVPNFDAFYTTCIKLEQISRDSLMLAPPMSLGTPEDARNQAGTASYLEYSTSAAGIPSGVDPRVDAAISNIGFYKRALDELVIAADDYFLRPSNATYASWEEAWIVATSQGRLVSNGCL